MYVSHCILTLLEIGAMYLPLCLSCVREFNLSFALGRLSDDEADMWRVGAGHADYQPKKPKGGG